MIFSFLQPAKDELNEAIAYYEAQREGLGEEFAQEIINTVQRILDHPKAWSNLSGNIRRCRTNPFPYGVVYQIRGDDILIVAIMHLHPRPGYWKDRLERL
jgi:plasmid stabilization system protein ParE